MSNCSPSRAIGSPVLRADREHDPYSQGSVSPGLSASFGAAILPYLDAALVVEPPVPLLISVVVILVLFGISITVTFKRLSSESGIVGEDPDTERRKAEVARFRANPIFENISAVIDVSEEDEEPWRRALHEFGHAERLLKEEQYEQANEYASQAYREAGRLAERRLTAARETIQRANGEATPGGDIERAQSLLDAAESAVADERHDRAWLKARRAALEADPDPDWLTERARTSQIAASESYDIEAELDAWRDSRDAYERLLEMAEAQDAERAVEQLTDQLEDVKESIREVERSQAVERIRELTRNAADAGDEAVAYRKDGELLEAKRSLSTAIDRYGEARAVAEEHDLDEPLQRIEEGLGWARERAANVRLDLVAETIEDAAKLVPEEPQLAVDKTNGIFKLLSDISLPVDRDKRVAKLRRRAIEVKLTAAKVVIREFLEQADTNIAEDRLNHAETEYRNALQNAEMGIEIAEKHGFNGLQTEFKEFARTAEDALTGLEAWEELVDEEANAGSRDAE